MSLDKILEKEQRLNDLKKWLEDFKKQSLSANDDTPLVLDDTEKAKIKEIEEIIQKGEKRINELKGASGESSEGTSIIEKAKSILLKIQNLKQAIK